MNGWGSSDLERTSLNAPFYMPGSIRLDIDDSILYGKYSDIEDEVDVIIRVYTVDPVTSIGVCSYYNDRACGDEGAYEYSIYEFNSATFQFKTRNDLKRKLGITDRSELTLKDNRRNALIVNNNIYYWNGKTFVNGNQRIIADGCYIIRSAHDKNCVVDLDRGLARNGNNILCWTQDNQKKQLWWVENIKGGIVIKSAVNRSFSLDVTDRVANNGINIQLWEYVPNAPNQVWIPEKTEDGIVLHSQADYTQVIDADRNDNLEGRNIQTWYHVVGDRNATNQVWIFEKMR